jgi:hypothetical protein
MLQQAGHCACTACEVAPMISFFSVEMTSVTTKPGKEKGMGCNEKLLLKTCVRSAFLSEQERQRLSTTRAGEPVL